jgi:hypothetical protein
MVCIYDPHFCSRIVLYTLYVRRNVVVCPQEPLLKLDAQWVKKVLDHCYGIWTGRQGLVAVSFENSSEASRSKTGEKLLNLLSVAPSGNACYHSVQSLLSSRLLSRNVKVKIYKTIILPLVLHGCETWFLTLREENRLRVFENRVLRRIFGPKKDEVTGERRKLHNEELHILYSSPNIIRQIRSRRTRWAGHVARMGVERNVYRVLMGKLEGKRRLGRPRRRWEDVIRMDLREVRLDPVGSG